jgi:hypothetical protein
MIRMEKRAGCTTCAKIGANAFTKRSAVNGLSFSIVSDTTVLYGVRSSTPYCTRTSLAVSANSLKLLTKLN